MRTLHVGLKVSNMERSLAFYRALGYRIVGAVAETPLGALTMLALPNDPFVALELVHTPGQPVEVGGLSHVVVQVESMQATAASLSAQGIKVGATTIHDQHTGFATAWISDPDGYRIELVQWPAGHPDGMTSQDFENPA